MQPNRVERSASKIAVVLLAQHALWRNKQVIVQHPAPAFQANLGPCVTCSVLV